ncbi:hypothetical protein PCC7424_3800 [Gloeothece citriformis PCC 7424]|uniref:Uncharacterized protein n=1 Tax=Gloeothece citriformis (strain PCC 7424) TaxID=65393 RepID=B7KJ97_GLOC7|nr:hypothetical protein [Gloeothece citriformis]ACK72181.1 hypothetical protein PCC7424_3800 [Gloeothece citriformis PCC 7424]
MPKYKVILTNTVFNNRQAITLTASDQQMAIKKALGQEVFTVWTVDKVLEV